MGESKKIIIDLINQEYLILSKKKSIFKTLRINPDDLWCLDDLSIDQLKQIWNKILEIKNNT
jgi:hypothetical protein